MTVMGLSSRVISMTGLSSGTTFPAGDDSGSALMTKKFIQKQQVDGDCLAGFCYVESTINLSLIR